MKIGPSPNSARAMRLCRNVAVRIENGAALRAATGASDGYSAASSRSASSGSSAMLWMTNSGWACGSSLDFG